MLPVTCRGLGVRMANGNRSTLIHSTVCDQDIIKELDSFEARRRATNSQHRKQSGGKSRRIVKRDDMRGGLIEGQPVVFRNLHAARSMPQALFITAKAPIHAEDTRESPARWLFVGKQQVQKSCSNTIRRDQES